MIESGFIEVEGQALPPDCIEPLPEVSGSTSTCAMVRLQGRRLFLKRLRPELAGHPRYVALMQKEFETGSQLQHPNLVQYVTMDEDIEGPYLLTEYVDGETLAHRMADKSRPQVNIQKTFTQLLQCLGYLHSRQVIHLDLKPDNILLTRVGDNVKLIDLGFCYTDSFDLTMGRNAVYSAPEQQQADGRPDHRSDLYAAGRLLADLCQIYPEQDNRQLQRVIARSTATDPNDRYQSAEEMLADVEASAHTGMRWYRSLRWLIPLAAVLLAGCWMWSRTDASPAVRTFALAQDNPLYRILSDDSLTCSVCGIHIIGPDSNMMVYSQAKYSGRTYSVIEVADSAFCQSQQLRSLSIGEGVRSIGIDACYECRNLVSVSLPSTLTTLHDGAFSSCHRLREILLPPHLSSIGHGAFVGTYALRHITIPEGITCLPTDCFVSSGIESISLPSTLRVLERGVFFDCRHLRAVTLPASIERIGEYCFLHCDSLRQVTILAPTPPAITNVFADTTGLRRTLFVPKGSIEAYQQAPYWQEFAVIRTIE